MRGDLYKDYKTLQLLREESIVNKIEKKKKKLKKEFEDKKEEIEKLKERKRVHRESMSNYREYVLTELTATALRAIYMSAVTETTVLTRESKIIGENMAIKYIVENGGVYNVLNKMHGTYFLERLHDIICEAGEEATKKKETEKEDKKAAEEKEDDMDMVSGTSKDDPDEDKDSSETSEDDNDTEDDKDDSSDEKDTSEKKEDSKEDKKESSDDKEEDDESDEDIDMDDDSLEDNSNDDLTAETKEEMLNKLEEEEDTDTAIDIIAQRISKAEEEFIKKNADDKQKIEDIVDGINDRINGAKSDPNNSDEDVEELEQEAAIEMKRKINKIRDDRPHTVFEMMVRQLSEGIMNDTGAINEEYTDESGKINMESVVEVAKCVYGFLEFVNTVQLEKVDEAYIKHMIENM